MDYRTEIEDHLIEWLRGAVGLEGVRTFETSIRECLFSGDKLTQGFRPEELPAIAVSAQLKPARKQPWTSGERSMDIPVSLTVITRAPTPRAALQAAAALQDAVDRVLDLARRSGNQLGSNAVVVGEVASSATTIEEKPYSFAISTSEFSILKVVEIG